jgi:hypothetical protein
MLTYNNIDITGCVYYSQNQKEHSRPKEASDGYKG